MRKERTAAIFFLSILAFLAGMSNASARPTIEDIRFESPNVSADRIIFVLNGPHLPTGKALPGDNPRVYFDFPDTIPANKVKNRMPVNGNFVKQIRHAFHKGTDSRTRVVFDLVANQKMDFRQDFDRDTNTLVITLYLAGSDPEPFVTGQPHATATETAAVPAPEPEPSFQEIRAEESTIAVQPAEDASIAAADQPLDIEPAPMVPPQALDLIPEPAGPAVDQTPVETAAPEPALEPEPPQEAETPLIAAIPPPAETTGALEGPTEEATLIQPMSEIGTQTPDGLDTTPPVLHSIEFDPKSNRGEMISFRLNGFHPPVVFGIEEDLPRIVCFFKNATAGAELMDMIETNGQYVKNIRVGKYRNPDNIRVVLELIPGYNYDLQQIFFKDDKMFMMIINKAGKQLSSQGN